MTELILADSLRDNHMEGAMSVLTDFLKNGRVPHAFPETFLQSRQNLTSRHPGRARVWREFGPGCPKQEDAWSRTRQVSHLSPTLVLGWASVCDACPAQCQCCASVCYLLGWPELFWVQRVFIHLSFGPSATKWRACSFCCSRDLPQRFHFSHLHLAKVISVLSRILFHGHTLKRRCVVSTR